MKKILENADKIQNNAGKMSDKMKENGIALTLSGIVAVLFILIFSVFMFIFVQKVLPSNDEELAQIRKEVVALSKTRKLSLDDFKAIAPLRTEASILDIYRQVTDIIDNNSIVENIDLINRQVEIVINNTVDRGRGFLIGLNFVNGTVEKLTVGTDILKETAIHEINNAFLKTRTNLIKLDEELKNCENNFLKSPAFNLHIVLAFIKRRDECFEGCG